jgi:hypothetical protein
LRQFISHRYRRLLKHHALNTFQDFWGLPENWVEEPNNRRGGWSGVSFHKLSDNNGDSFSIFVKRQENHKYFSFGNPCQARPTFFREFTNIYHLEQIGVPSVEPVFYGERFVNDRLQAVLATVALDHYSELNALFKRPSIKESIRKTILYRIADTLRLIHSRHLRHGSLSGAHVLVKLHEDDSFDIRILDLEKMRRSWYHLYAAIRDIERFVRHTPTLNKIEHAEFVRHYARYFKPMQQRLLVKLTNQFIVKRSYSKGCSLPLIHLSELAQTAK